MKIEILNFSVHSIPEEDTRQREEFAERLQRLGKASPEYVKKILAERDPAEPEPGLKPEVISRLQQRIAEAGKKCE
jgi:hypothetical protein